jgi:indolepyruvate ferredoxin oxidoreductase beta subunit
MILSVEPMEALRYVPYLAQDGWMITNATPVKNIANYPSEDAVYAQVKAQPHNVLLDADAIAKELGNARAMNMVMLGAASLYLDLPLESLEGGVRTMFERKGEEVVAMNLAALRKGREIAENA